MNAREKEILKKFWDFKVKSNKYKPINDLQLSLHTILYLFIILLQIYYFLWLYYSVEIAKKTFKNQPLLPNIDLTNLGSVDIVLTSIVVLSKVLD